MWIDTILDSWVDFITIIVGFSVAIIGILTKTTEEDKKWPNNVTFFGWILVVFAILNLSFTWHKNFQKSKKQEQVRYWVITEIEQATFDLIVPYFLNSDPPDGEHRFELAGYLTDPDIAMGICETDLLEPVGRQYQIWELGNAFDTWAEVLTKHTERGNEKLKLVLSSYSSILETDTIVLIGQLTIHPWIEFVKDSQKRKVRNMERNPELNQLILGSNKEKLRLRYVKLAFDFGKKLERLEKNIKDQYDNLYARLDRNDPLPLFYRQLSGLMYLPKLNGNNNQTEHDN